MTTLFPPELSAFLFPATPVEVIFEDGEYHIFIEGDWHGKEIDLEGVQLHAEEAFDAYGEDWLCPSVRMCPEWEGWDKVDVFSLAAMIYGEE